MVTKKQIMSHHFGFGNIDVGNLETIRNKHTSVSPSLKFKEKLQLKQRQLEVSKSVSYFNSPKGTNDEQSAQETQHGRATPPPANYASTSSQ
jgi:hypothetical protein